MINTKSVIVTKNLTRQGKGELRTQTGNIPVEVKKIGSLYFMIVDGNRNGLNKLDAESCWKMMAEYLGANLREEK